MASGQDRTGRTALAGGALVAVVAIVSRGSLFHDARHNDGLGRAAAYALGAFLVLLFVFGLVLALLGLRGSGTNRPPPRNPWRMILITVIIVGAMAIASPFIRRGNAQRNVSPPIETITIASNDCTAPCDAPLHSPGASPWWIAIAAAVLVGALLVVGARGSTIDGRAIAIPDRERARSLFDTSLDDLYAEPDPRRAIAMAYGRLLDGLASCGLARANAETPYEHLARALGDLNVAPDSLTQLTTLFSEARFSDHVLTSVHKQQAIDAFRSARDSLVPHLEPA